MCNTFILLLKKNEWIHEHNTLYICMLHFFSSFFPKIQVTTMKVEFVQQREKKKKKVQVSTSVNDKHEERMQR